MDGGKASGIREPSRSRERPSLVMSGHPDDNRLIAACRSGKTEAFGVLVSRYQDRLYPTVFRLTGCAEDALDLLQEAFLRAYQKLDHFNGESSFYTWVYRIAVNLALSDLRKRRPAASGGLSDRSAGPAGGGRPVGLARARRARGADPAGAGCTGPRSSHDRGDEGVRRPPLRRDRGDAGHSGRDGAEPVAPGALRASRAAPRPDGRRLAGSYRDAGRDLDRMQMTGGTRPNPSPLGPDPSELP